MDKKNQKRRNMMKKCIVCNFAFPEEKTKTCPNCGFTADYPVFLSKKQYRQWLHQSVEICRTEWRLTSDSIRAGKEERDRQETIRQSLDETETKKPEKSRAMMEEHDREDMLHRSGQAELKAEPSDDTSGISRLSPEVPRKQKKTKWLIPLLVCLLVGGGLGGNHVWRSLSSDDVQAGLSENTEKHTAASKTENTAGNHTETTEVMNVWDDVLTSIQNHTYRQKYKIGETITLDLGAEGILHMQIAAFDADILSDGSGTAAITWISQETLATEQPMNADASKSGGWEESDLRSYLQHDIYPLLPSNVRNGIRTVKKQEYYGSTTITTDDTLWIPDADELNGIYSELFSNPDIGSWNKSGAGSFWWLRQTGENYSFYDIVDDSGTTSIKKGNTEGGVVLCFCT